MRRLWATRATLIALSALSASRGEEPVDFVRDVQPIFRQHCVKCHGGVHREGGLSLLAHGGEEWAGDSGKRLVVVGEPGRSELIRRITTEDGDERMPAERPPLDRGDIETLRRWVAEGAKWPRHWAFEPLRAEKLRVGPAGENSSLSEKQKTLIDHASRGARLSQREREWGDWPHNAIDRFVLERLAVVKVAPSAEAERHTLVRRLSLDLLGLPPTIEEAEAFANDRSEDAYERLIDRLLANPHFGERWGRHWLDQARYADSDGYEVDKARPDAWRWRDWVIGAINSDMPFDEFTALQFAGDLMPDAGPLSHLATAYHRQTLTNNEGGVDKEEYRLKAVLDRVSNTGNVWLGLTLGCAQCHDHPYDAFTQREFYSLAAIFNNADETEIELADGAAGGSRRPTFRVLSERSEPRTTRLLERGEFLTPGEEVGPGLPGMLGVASAELGRRNAEQDDHSSALLAPRSALIPTRLELARWLVDPANPLTARVLANQIWLRLFGTGLVRTPEDFGVRGEQPTHPELLDWLGGELVVRGWSRKGMIRLVVESATYRQASRQRAELAADLQNRLLARQNRVRVEAEIVRDLWLAAGGLLSGKIGGASVYPPLSPEFVKITFRSELPWKVSPGEDRYRRGMYTFFKRSVPHPDLMIFDCPDANAAAVQRPASNTPLQALLTLNSEMCVEAARGLASKGSGRYSDWSTRGVQGSVEDRGEGTGDGDKVGWMFRRCLTRPPVESELERLTELLRAQRRWYERHPEEAVAMAGESATAEAAALVATASVIMNLDEFITRE